MIACTLKGSAKSPLEAIPLAGPYGSALVVSAESHTCSLMRRFTSGPTFVPSAAVLERNSGASRANP